jgi:hypothetical protein
MVFGLTVNADHADRGRGLLNAASSAVSRTRSRPSELPARDRELMAEHKDLKLPALA